MFLQTKMIQLKSKKLFGNLQKEITILTLDNKVSLGKEKISQIPKIRQTKEGKRINSHFQQHFAMFLRTNYEKR